MLTGNCAEVGPRLTVNASAYTERPTVLRARRGTKRCLVVNFAGAIARNRTLASVEFRMFEVYTAAMSNARIDGKLAIVDLDANGLGHCLMRCTATLDNGEKYPVVFELAVSGAPWFWNETFPVAGPGQLIAVAE
jgi:hypothetical protein